MPILSLSSLPDTYVAGRIRYEAGWRSPGRCLHEAALYYVFSGKMRFSFEETSIRLSGGSAFLLTKGTAYTARAEEDCDYCFFHFKTEAPNIAAPPNEKRKHTHLPMRENGVFLPPAVPIETNREQTEHLCSQALRYAACKSPYDKVRLDVTLLRLLILLAEGRAEAEPRALSPKSRSTYLAAKEYIEAHYTDPLSLAAVSSSLGVSPQYLSRVFRRHAGCSVTSFIQSTRLMKSQELLRYTPLSVTEIAYAVGFSSPYYYSRLFSRAYGIAPTEFRHAAREEL